MFGDNIWKLLPHLLELKWKWFICLSTYLFYNVSFCIAAGIELTNRCCNIISGVLCQKQASRAGTINYIPQILWSVIIFHAFDTCTWHNTFHTHVSMKHSGPLNVYLGTWCSHFQKNNGRSQTRHMPFFILVQLNIHVRSKGIIWFYSIVRTLVFWPLHPRPWMILFLAR